MKRRYICPKIERIYSISATSYLQTSGVNDGDQDDNGGGMSKGTGMWDNMDWDAEDK